MGTAWSQRKCKMMYNKHWISITNNRNWQRLNKIDHVCMTPFKKKLRRSGHDVTSFSGLTMHHSRRVLLLPYVVHLHHPHHPASLDTCPSSRDHQRLASNFGNLFQTSERCQVTLDDSYLLPSNVFLPIRFLESFHQDQVLHINWFLYSIVCLYGPYGMKNPQKELYSIYCLRKSNLSMYHSSACLPFGTYARTKEISRNASVIDVEMHFDAFCLTSGCSGRLGEEYLVVTGWEHWQWIGCFKHDVVWPLYQLYDISKEN